MRTICMHTKVFSRPLRLRPRLAPASSSAPSILHARKAQSRFSNVWVAAGEDAPGQAQDQAADASSTTNHLPPIQRVKALLKEHDIQSAELSSALAATEEELGDLRDRLSIADVRIISLEATAQNGREQLTRLAADFDNFRKRTSNEKDALQDSIRGDLVANLLPVVDNFELARTQVKAETEGEQKINNSYQSLYKQMVDMMRALGVEAIETTNMPFDPAFHEAIMREPNNDLPDGTVVLEFRKGFKIGNKLVRPAMVKVSYQEDAPAPAAESS